mmetsp:Transcript_22494/g.62391  ORF Transcript_22494/g.62391 Transcript_22494/m.62391 type:complete len:221 (-) Transcript_22494:711-1373(-)
MKSLQRERRPPRCFPSRLPSRCWTSRCPRSTSPMWQTTPLCVSSSGSPGWGPILCPQCSPWRMNTRLCSVQTLLCPPAPARSSRRRTVTSSGTSAVPSHTQSLSGTHSESPRRMQSRLLRPFRTSAKRSQRYSTHRRRNSRRALRLPLLQRATALRERARLRRSRPLRRRMTSRGVSVSCGTLRSTCRWRRRRWRKPSRWWTSARLWSPFGQHRSRLSLG